MRIIAATKNKGKIKEIQAIFAPLGFTVISQAEEGIDLDVEETGTTFLENSLLKARAVHEASGEAVIADDSGLMVDALGGAPGVYSARYAGENATDFERMTKLLAEMSGKENRTASFTSVVSMILADGREFSAEGKVIGEICREMHGENGFGYDPIFFADELGKTFGEASDEEKNRISHRSRALTALYEQVKGKI